MATAKAATRYNVRSLQTVIDQLKGWMDQTEDTLGNAQDADYPNDERIESLENRLSSLEEARDALQAIVDEG